MNPLGLAPLNLYGDLFGIVPVWIWVVLGAALLIWGAVMYLRIFGGSAAGTVQDQRDRSSHWARSRADVEELIMTGPDSRRLPLGTLVTGTRKKAR